MDQIKKSPLERLLLKDKIVLGVTLGALTLWSWYYLLSMGMMISSDFMALFIMWAVMMVGMMVPSATPAILLYANIYRQQTSTASPLQAALCFLGGYLLAWTGFSVVAAYLQIVLTEQDIISQMMAGRDPYFNAGLLIFAGLYQLSDFKRQCLDKCQSPMVYIQQHWRPGLMGLTYMGLRHGLYCTGCCWMLMILLFVFGVMNLWVVLLLTLYVLLEKIMPPSYHLDKITAFGLIAYSGWILFGGAA